MNMHTTLTVDVFSELFTRAIGHSGNEKYIRRIIGEGISVADAIKTLRLDNALFIVKYSGLVSQKKLDECAKYILDNFMTKRLAEHLKTFDDRRDPYELTNCLRNHDLIRRIREESKRSSRALPERGISKLGREADLYIHDMMMTQLKEILLS